MLISFDILAGERVLGQNSKYSPGDWRIETILVDEIDSWIAVMHHFRLDFDVCPLDHEQLDGDSYQSHSKTNCQQCSKNDRCRY